MPSVNLGEDGEVYTIDLRETNFFFSYQAATGFTIILHWAESILSMGANDPIDLFERGFKNSLLNFLAELQERICTTF